MEFDPNTNNSDPLLVKARGFTEVEIPCLAEWLREVLAGNLAKADAILRTGLLLEHYESLLSENASQITPEQRAVRALLQSQFNDALKMPDNSEPAPVPVPDPPQVEPFNHGIV
jgi:hypothetical protein